MNSHVQASPLRRLGQELTEEVTEEEVCSSTSSSGEFKPVPKDAPSTSTTSVPVIEASRFSISSWRTKIAQRAIDQKLSHDLEKSVCPSSASTRPDADKSGDVVVSTPPVDVPVAEGGQANELARWLVGYFKERDASRTERTAVALKSLVRAGEMKRAEEMLTLTREGILTLTRESWHMLQERHPSSIPDLPPPPGQAPMPIVEQNVARSSRCPTYMALAPNSSRQTPGGSEPDECGSGRASSRGDTETASTGASLCPASRESSTLSSDQTASVESSVTLSDSSELGHSTDSDQLGNGGRFTMGHRDDWELQYMLNGAFDEMHLRLESGQAQDLQSLLEGARSRVLEWTVRRWQSCQRDDYPII